MNRLAIALCIFASLTGSAWAGEKEDAQAQVTTIQTQIAQVTIQWAQAQNLLLNQQLATAQERLKEIEAKESSSGNK